MFAVRSKIPGVRTRGAGGRASMLWMAVLSVVALVVSSFAYQGTQAGAAVTPLSGTMVEGSLTGTTGPALTLPRGAVWVADGTGVAAGGHWWVSDQIGGICRVDPTGAANAPQFTLTNCNAGGAKSGGQIVVGNVPGSATNKYFYIADAASRSIKIARSLFNFASGTLGGSSIFNVPNLSQKGGGLAGGRPVALALVANPGTAVPASVAKTCTNLVTGAGGGWPTALAAGEQDLLVSYIKSGDIIRVFNVNQTTVNGTAPCQAQIGSTSDGLGVNAFAMVGNDLYLSEIGGLGGVSKIPDPTGVTRPACTACAAVGIGSTVGFPGGMASDGSTYLYVADARTGGATNFVYRVTAATGATELYSNAVTPSYTARNSSQAFQTFTSYVFPLAVGYRADTGEVYVGDDPQFLAATVTSQQGHLWRIPFTPVVASVNPNNGANAGGLVVTISGQGFIPGTTTFKFGGVAAVGVVCASSTSCTAITPAGSGVVDVAASVTVPGMPFPATTGTLAGAFTYTTAVAPAVTGIAPTIGPLSGGTVVTITGTGFDTTGLTTVNFVPTAGALGAANAATAVSCSSSTQCIATSPAATTPTGIQPADVQVTVGGLTSTANPADVFTYDTAPIVTGLTPSTGPITGATAVTINGTGFDTTGNTTVTFGGVATTPPGTFVTCASTTSCVVTSPATAATVVVDVVVQDPGGTSAVNPTDQFTYTTATTPTVTVVAPNKGVTAGGTVVTINGSNFTNVATATPTVFFGANQATFVSCVSASVCTADSPAGAAGLVNVTVVVNDPANPVATLTSPITIADQFTYSASSASLYAWGITAPKGGAVWIPGTLGGHWWSSDHAQGLCRQDVVPTTGPFGVAGNTLHAINFAVCGNDTIGSAGQAVYDPRPVVIGPTTFANLHYVYVPDNAVRSTAVWRLTFDATTETMVPDPLDGITLATAMAPLVDQRTLKPNGMALGPLNPDGTLNTASPNFGLYVTDLVERYVRLVTNPDGDPRTQNITIAAATGDGRGANGTQGFIGNSLYISGNRATQFIDVSLLAPAGVGVGPAAGQCPIQPNGVAPIPNPPCGMASVPAPTGVFVAGTAVDPVRKLVYISNSPGAAASLIYRYDASHDLYRPFLDGAWLTPGSGVVIDLNNVVHCEVGTFGANPFSPGIGCLLGPAAGQILTGGNLPGPATPNGTVVCALTCQRPWDQANHPTAAAMTAPVASTFAFAFGMAVGPNGELIITEDPSAGARSGRGTMWSVPFVP